MTPCGYTVLGKLAVPGAPESTLAEFAKDRGGKLILVRAGGPKPVPGGPLPLAAEALSPHETWCAARKRFGPGPWALFLAEEGGTTTNLVATNYAGPLAVLETMSRMAAEEAGRNVARELELLDEAAGLIKAARAALLKTREWDGRGPGAEHHLNEAARAVAAWRNEVSGVPF